MQIALGVGNKGGVMCSYSHSLQRDCLSGADWVTLTQEGAFIRK